MEMADGGGGGGGNNLFYKKTWCSSKEGTMTLRYEFFLNWEPESWIKLPKKQEHQQSLPI